MIISIISLLAALAAAGLSAWTLSNKTAQGKDTTQAAAVGTLATCVPAAPILNDMFPAYVTLGQVSHSSFTITNMDSPGCPPTTFTISITAPDGWMVLPSTQTITLAGGTYSIWFPTEPAYTSVFLHMDVTVPSDTLTGQYYPMGFSVSDGKNPLHTKSVTRQTGVYSTNDTTPPKITITSPKNGSRAPKNLTVSATAIDDSGFIGSIQITAANGFVNGSCDSFQLTNGTTCNILWAGFSDHLPKGTYSLIATAYDLNGNAASTSIKIVK